MPTPRTRLDRPVPRTSGQAGTPAEVLAFADIAQVAMLVVVKNRIVFASQTAERMLGYARHGLTRHSLRSVITPEHVPLLRQAQPAVRAGRRVKRAAPAEPARSEVLAVRRNGERIWLETRLSPIDWETRRASLVVLTDVSVRKRAEQKLQDSEQRYRQLVESSIQGITVLQDGKVLMANRAFAAMFGYRGARGIARGTPFSTFLAPAERARFRRLHRDRLAGRAMPSRVEYECRRRDGTPVWIQALPRRVEWEGKPAVFATVLDITEPRRSEQKLRASQRILQTFFDAIPEPLVLKDRQSRFIKVNRTQAEFAGLRPEEFVGKSTAWLARLHGYDAKETLAQEAEMMRTGRPIDIPFAPRRVDGKLFWYRLIKVPLRNAAGEIVGMCGMAINATDLKLAQDRLRDSEQLLQTVFETIPGRLFITDQRGRYLKVNREQADAFGVKPEDLVGKSNAAWSRKIGVPSAVVREEERRIFRLGQRIEIPARRRLTLAGTEHWYHAIKVPLRNPDNRIIGQLGLMLDVTESRRTEEALRASEQLLQTVFDAIPEPLFVKDRDGRFLKVNQELARVYGVTPAEMVGKPWSYVAMSGADPGAVQAEDLQVIRTGRRVEIPETPRKTPEGTRWYKFIKVPLRDTRGEIAGLIALAMDVTERRNAEEALRAQQRLLRTVFDAMPLRMTVKDRAGKFLMVNRAHVEAVGDAAETYLGKTIAEVASVPGWRRKLYQDLEAQVVRSKRQAEIPELAMKGPAGSAIAARMVKLPILDEHGEVEGIVTLWEDISERLAAERELRRGRRLLQTVFDAIPHEMTVKDASGRYLIINRAYSRHFGVSERELAGRTADETGHLMPALREALNVADRKVIEERTLVDMVDMPAMGADGILRRHRILKVPLLDEEGKPEGVVTLSEDITERLAAEQELSRSRRLLQSVFDIIPYNLFVRDTAGRFVMANPALARFFGRRTEELVGASLEQLGIDPAESARWLEQDRQVIETGQVFDSADYPVVRPDGSEGWLHTIKLPLRDDAGQIVGVIALGEDITSRKQAERALRENQEILEEAQAVGHIGSWSALVDTPGSLRWSPEVYRIFGIPPGAFDGQGATVQRYIHSDDRESVRQALLRALKGDAPYDDEYRIVRPDGTLRWVHARAEVRRDAQGRVTQLVGVVQDITERKAAEQALLANQRLLQAVLDAIPHNVFVKDRSSRLVLVNRAHNRFWGTAGGRPNLDTAALQGLTPELADQWTKADREVMETGRIVEREGDEVKLPSGRKVWLRWIKVPWRDEHDQVIGVVGLSEDISARVEAEAALRSQQRLIQAVFDTIPHEVFVKDRRGSFVLVNQSFAAFYGLTPHQLIGLPTGDLPGVLPDILEGWLTDDQRVMESGQPVDRREFHYVSSDGRETWFDLRKFPWRDDQNRVIGVVGVREDITARRHTEELVRSNRRLLRTVFDTIPHLLYVKDAQSRYIMVNAPMAQVYGITAEQMAGMYTLDLPGAIEEQQRDLLETDRRVIETGTPVYQPEVEIYEGERGTHWYSIIKLPLRDEQGRTVGIVGLSQDITERRRAENELQANRRLLRAVFDAVPFWLMVRGKQGQATLVNRRMADDYGVEPDDFLGKTMQQDPSLRPEEKAAMETLDEDVRRTLQPVGIPELSLTLPGGRVRLMRMVVIPLFDDRRLREGELILAEDITDRKRSEQALLQAQKLESLGVLAGGIAHDFNNLLVAILGNASLALLKLKQGAAGREELGQIELAGQRAAELCRQMLAYAGKSPIEMQRVDVNGLVHEMTQLLRVSLPKGVAISFRLAPTLPAVQGDPTQIRQVVMNLVINAGEAIGDKQGVITITTGTQEVDREYLDRSQAAPDATPGRYMFLEVSDSGHGMSPETLARVFDPFFTTKFTGRGLGLASVIGIIRGHRGALRVYSEVGVGSAFRVLLPAANSHSVEAPEAPAPAAWKEGGLVLVVDDEAEIRSVAEKMLNHLGFSVLQAAGGAEALAALGNLAEPLQAALIDLTMPGMAGEEVVRELRRMRERLPVLVMSGYNESDMQSRFMGRPNTEFLQKPFTLAALHAKMRTLLGDPSQG